MTQSSEPRWRRQMHRRIRAAVTARRLAAALGAEKPPPTEDSPPTP